MTDIRQLTQDIASAPLGDLIAAVGRGVAEAQAALDAASLEQTLALYDQSDELQGLLRDVGYRPTFYTIPKTEGELRLSLTVSTQTGGSKAVRPAAPIPPSLGTVSALGRLSGLRGLSKIYAAPVDSRYQNTYSFNSEVSAAVRFSIVAVPPTSAAEAARVVPDFVGLTFSEALAIAESFDLGVIFEGDEPASDAEVATQNIPAGQLVNEGTQVLITVA